jgi:hypothetical protein
MPRPICAACGGICIEAVTALEVRRPYRPTAAYVVCADCAEELLRRLSARRPEPAGSRSDRS